MATSPIFSFTEPVVGGDNGVWGGFLNTDWANLDTYLGVLRQAAKTLSIGATTTLDFSAPASVFKLTVTQATTIAIANTPANITAQQLSTQFTLLITNGGAFAVTWPGSFVWSGGVAPNLQVAGTDIVVGWSPDNGTTWYTGMLATAGKSSLSKIGQLGGLAITSVADISYGTISLSGGKLGTDHDLLRITITGRYASSDAASGGVFKFKFGSATLTFTPVSDGQGEIVGGSLVRSFTIVISVTRLSATTQRITGVMTNDVPSGLIGHTVAGNETLANPVTLDFRGGVVNAALDTISLDSAIVEAATQ